MYDEDSFVAGMFLIVFYIFMMFVTGTYYMYNYRYYYSSQTNTCGIEPAVGVPAFFVSSVWPVYWFFEGENVISGGQKLYFEQMDKCLATKGMHR